MNIDANVKIDELELVKYLKKIDSPFVSIISEIYNEVKDLLNTRVQYVFPNYTLHNTGHSFRIMQYMAKIVSNYESLNELEITLLILSALLHDVGMAVSEYDIQEIKSNKLTFFDLKFSSFKKLLHSDELALQDYVRRVHSSLSARFIRMNLADRLRIPNLSSLNYTNELALICESHTKDFDWIKSNLRMNEVRGDYYFNSQFIACILRLADILDIDSNRTPYKLYKVIAPIGISKAEWEQHFIISNNNKVEVDEKTGLKKIVFHGKAENPSIHRKLLSYIEWVRQELSDVVEFANGMAPQYNLIYNTIPEVNIQTDGYTFSDYKMTLNFKAISSLLMGENIYGSKDLGLRELIQNSIDSCKIRNEVEQLATEFGDEAYKPKIKIILDEPKNEVVIKDNGTGMTLDVIKNHFLNIGVSYYASDSFLLKDFIYKPIGNFGIGFLACFMLSNTVKVITRHYKFKNKYNIELEQGNEWTSLTEKEDVTFDGTEVILNYANFMSVFKGDEHNVSSFLETNFLTDGIELDLINRSSKKSLSIKNSLYSSKKNTSGLLVIDLSKYLRDVTGTVTLRPQKGFVASLDDVNFSGELYSFSEIDGLIPVENLEELLLSDYILDGKLSYYTIPLVPRIYEDEFINGLKFTGDDIDEVISKMDRDLNWISILVPKEYQDDMRSVEFTDSTRIIDSMDYDDLVSLGHSNQCNTKANVETVDLYEHIKDEMYVDYTLNKLNFRRFFFGNSYGTQFFLRGVLLKDFSLNIPIAANAFTIESIRVNLESRKFIPNISRNNIDDAKSEIDYLIGKAIHLGAIDLLSISPPQRQALKDFVQHYYAKKTAHEK
jgi:molecular chaperone HtpG